MSRAEYTQVRDASLGLVAADVRASTRHGEHDTFIFQDPDCVGHDVLAYVVGLSECPV